MSAPTAAGQASLFAAVAEATPEAVAPPPMPVGLRPAAARLVVSTAPDMHDRERRPLLFLVVDCPFCDSKHIHPGGHPGEPRLCIRRSRCVGRPAGAYYFPGVS